MIDFSYFYALLQDSALAPFLPALKARVAERLTPERWGDLAQWQAQYQALPALAPRHCDLNRDWLQLGGPDELDDQMRQRIETGLRALHPWRKGPYEIYGIRIDTEWRSDWKWQRLAPHIQSLAGRRVLDVGCGSGYHCWRMLGAGAAWVLGIDPSPKFVYQFAVLHKLAGGHWPLAVLPLGIEDMPESAPLFDTVFSMGVLYHRRSPFEHLYQLKSLLRPGGELVLETLVVPGPEGMTLLPADRYAKMRNVWLIPSSATLIRWLERCGFEGVRLVDETPTLLTEQRRTDWMRFESLADFLDPADPGRTIEGYPAPRRAILLASRPTQGG